MSDWIKKEPVGGDFVATRRIRVTRLPDGTSIIEHELLERVLLEAGFTKETP